MTQFYCLFETVNIPDISCSNCGKACSRLEYTCFRNVFFFGDLLSFVVVICVLLTQMLVIL
jgi:hypothetical protein